MRIYARLYGQDVPFEPLPLNAETLEHLLNEGGERAELDFKRMCDLRERRDIVELTKDIGAMQVKGGYIVVGADDNGQATGEVAPEHVEHFDEARLRGKIARYLPDGFEVRCAPVEHDGETFGLICVLPHPDGLVAFKADGTYQDGTGQTTAFRAGDVYTRDGSRSQRWTQQDIRTIRDGIRTRAREEARHEFQQLAVALQREARKVADAASAPAITLTWELDHAVLGEAVIEQLRVGDTIPALQLIKGVPGLAASSMASGARDEFERLLDGVVSLAARLLWAEQLDIVGRTIESLAAVFNATFDSSGYKRQDLAIPPAEAYLEIIGRVIGLGALAARERQWGVVRTIATQPTSSHDNDYWATWLFYGAVQASRAGLLRDEERRHGKNLLVVARENVSRLDCLRPDGIAADSDTLVTSLCQFDMMAAVATLSLDAGRSHGGSFLLWSAEWWANRTDPVVVGLVTGGPSREVLYPGADEDLAAALGVIAYNARNMARHVNGWSGFEAQPILDFLAKYQPPAT